MKKPYVIAIIAAVVLAATGCNKAPDVDPNIAPAPAQPGAAGGAAKPQNAPQASPPVMLGPGAAGADQRAGSKAGG